MKSGPANLFWNERAQRHVGQVRFEQRIPGIALLTMKVPRFAWFALLLAACIAGLLWHSWSASSTRSRRIVIGRDSADAAVGPTQLRSEYDFYFDRVNHSTVFVLQR